jgi:hypothetical protein
MKLSLLCNLGSRIFFQIIFIGQITILPIVRNWKTIITVLPLGGIVYRKKTSKINVKRVHCHTIVAFKQSCERLQQNCEWIGDAIIYNVKKKTSVFELW